MTRHARRAATVSSNFFVMARVVVTATQNRAVEGPVRTVGPVAVGVGMAAAAALMG